MKKKIAIVVNSSWHAWNMRFNLAFAIQKCGYKVIFITPEDKYSQKIKKFFNFKEIKLNARTINPIDDLLLLLRFVKIYKNLNPDVILHYTIKPNIYGTLAAKILKIPVINNINGLGTIFIKESFLSKIVKILYKISLKNADKIFFQNKSDFKIFVNAKIVKKDKSEVLPGSGVDTKKFKPMEKEISKKFIFLLVSRMLWPKGIQEFIDAAKIVNKKHKSIEFHLLGHLDVESPMSVSKKQMNSLVNGEYIKYLGSSDDVRQQISQSDCVILPSYYREGVPRVLLESASMAKPIITTFNAGCEDVVDNGINGYLCRIKDPIDLADKMIKIFNLSEDQRLNMGKLGRKKILNEFDESIVINKYLDLIKDFTSLR